MLNLYLSLSEKDRRRYAAIEANKLGHGGISYISALFGCDTKTINKGQIELADQEALKQASIRKQGGGRKKTIDLQPDIDQAFLDVLGENTAGDPMNGRVKWTSMTRSDISKALKKKGLSYGKARFFVFSRANQPCRVCKTKIQRSTANSRRIYTCATCQPDD